MPIANNNPNSHGNARNTEIYTKVGALKSPQCRSSSFFFISSSLVNTPQIQRNTPVQYSSRKSAIFTPSLAGQSDNFGKIKL